MGSTIKEVRRDFKTNIAKDTFNRNLLTYILSDIAYVLGPMVDGIVTGNYFGVNAVASYGLLRPALFVLTIFTSVLSAGSRSMYAELLGKGKTKEANGIFTLASIVSTVMAILIGSLALLIPDQIMEILGATGNNAYLASYGADYLRGYAPGLLFICASSMLSGYMSMDNDNGRVIYSNIILSAVNIAGDFYVVLFTDLGMFGLALVTSISYFAYFISLALHFRKKNRLLHLHLDKKIRTFSCLGKISARGSINAIMKLSGSLSGIIINNILSALFAGTVIAVYGAQSSVMALFGSLYVGTSESVWVLSSIYFGEEDRHSLNDLQIASMYIGMPITIICSVVMLVFPRFFAGLYLGHESAQALSMGSEAVKVLAISMCFNVFIQCFTKYIHGVKRTHLSNILMMVIQFAAPVLSMIISIKLLCQRGVWFSVLIADIMVTIVILMIILIQREKSFREKRLFIGDRISNYKDNNEIEMVADSMFDVTALAGIAMLFCQENGFSKRTASHLSLCIEEMCGNIIAHGFKDKNKHYIYVRILAKEDGIILRIRDDCRPFNPLERYKMTQTNDQDPTKNIGIRLVMGIASDVKYISTFKTNTLIIRIDEKRNPQEETDSLE